MPTPRQYASDADRQRAYRERQKQTLAKLLDAKNLPSSQAIPTLPSYPRWKALHEKARADIQTMRDEMEAYRDERSEQWQGSGRAEQFQEMLDSADTLLATLDEFSPRPVT